MRTAVFAGSFDPFTIGHADVVERGLAIFDSIIICVGVNIHKGGVQAAQSRAESISRVYAHEPRVSVECSDGLTAVFARQKGASALLRAVRSVKDFEYERDMADANRQLYGVDTVIFFASPQVSWVSSSLVRELQAYSQDVSRLLPLDSVDPCRPTDEKC